MFQQPKGMPYYYHDNMDQIATPCDPYKCDRFGKEHFKCTHLKSF